MSVRESTVYVQPGIEGYLDRKESGAFRTKTSRRRCWVQGAIFYQQKESTQGPGQIDVLDMSDVKLVRKVTADTTETQFEIVMKKPLVFTCTDRKDCNAWVKALLTAMTIKDTNKSQRRDSGSTFYASPYGGGSDIYDTIADTAHGPGQPPRVSNCPEVIDLKDKSTLSSKHYVDEENVYSSPADCVENQDGGGDDTYASPEDGADNVYSDVQEPATTPSNSLPEKRNGSTPHPPLSAATPPRSVTAAVPSISIAPCVNGDSPTPLAVDHDGNTQYADCCSMGQDKEQVYDEAVSVGRKQGSRYSKKGQQQNGNDECLSPTLPPRPSPRSPVAKRITHLQPPNTGNGQEEKMQNTTLESDEDYLSDLFNALDSEPLPIPELERELTPDDFTPLRDLKDCLRNNEIHCRVSANRLSSSQDPISACKAFLTTLDNVM